MVQTVGYDPVVYMQGIPSPVCATNYGTAMQLRTDHTFLVFLPASLDLKVGLRADNFAFAPLNLFFGSTRLAAHARASLPR